MDHTCLSIYHLREKEKMREKETKQERKKMWIKTAAAVICFAILAGVVVIQYVARTFTTYRIIHETEVVCEEGSRTSKMGDNLLIYSKDGIYCINSRGKMIWNITYQIQEPCLVTAGTMAAIGGYGDHLVYIVDETGLVGEINTNFPIRNLCVSENGYIGAVLDDNDVYWIYIYDRDGNEVRKARTTMEQTGYPLSISMSPNGKLLGISYLYLDAGVVRNDIAFYNLGGVGQNYTDNYMSGYIYEEIIPEIHYMDNQTAVAVSNERLAFFCGKEKPVSLKDVMFNEEIHGIYWGDEHVILIQYGTGNEGRYLMKVYDLSGNLVLEKGIQMEYTDIQSQNGIITIYNEKQLQVLTLDGRVRYEGSFGTNVEKIISTSRKYRYLVLSDGVFQVIGLE